MINYKSKTFWVTKTAVLVAMTVVLQALTLQIGNQFLTGSIVNMMLILSVLTCGLPTGLTVATVSPILPTLIGFGPLPPIVPVMILGNLSLVSIWHFAMNSRLSNRSIKYFIALIAASSVKFVVLYIGIVKFVAPLVLKVPDSSPIMVMFSFPQLITALIGGTTAIFVLPLLRKVIREE